VGTIAAILQQAVQNRNAGLIGGLQCLQASRNLDPEHLVDLLQQVALQGDGGTGIALCYS
jgi:hypothetical protein